MKRILAGLVLGLAGMACGGAAGADAPAGGAGSLVLAPDRGFQGNEEVREAFEDAARASPGSSASR
jgi:hypothetical protein